MHVAQSPAAPCFGSSLERSLKHFCRVRSCKMREKVTKVLDLCGQKVFCCNGNGKCKIKKVPTFA